MKTDNKNGVDLLLHSIKEFAKANKITFAEALEIYKLETEMVGTASLQEFHTAHKETLAGLTEIIELGKGEIKKLLKGNGHEAFAHVEVDHTPRVGDTVLFFPDETTKKALGNTLNGADYLPAIVVQKFANSKCINLAVLTIHGIFNYNSITPGNTEGANNINYFLTQEKN